MGVLADIVSTLLAVVCMVGYFGGIVALVVDSKRAFFGATGGARWWIGCGYVIMPEIFVPIYLIVLGRDYYLAHFSPEAKQRMALARQERTAQLEAQLGLLPPTDGTCAACGKALQVGATYCVYCGQPTVTRPRVCPQCHTTALPDARFCPQCRAVLTAV